MFNRSTSRSRFGLALASVVALLVFSAGSVAADTTGGGSGTFTQNGTSADTYTGGCTPNGDDTTTCWDAGLGVFTGKMSDSFSGVSHGNQVCAYLDSYVVDDLTGDYIGAPVFEAGCQVDLPSGAIRVGKNLSSLTLQTTTVSVAREVCDEYECVPGSTRNVSVGGTWTGIGPITSSKSRSSGDDGSCRYSDAGKGTSRESTFTGSIAGNSISDGYSYLSNGKFTYRSRCSEI